MAIYGAGAGQTIIDAANVDRVIHGDPVNTSRASLTLADVTLLDGQVTGDGGGLLAMGIGNYTGPRLGRHRLGDRERQRRRHPLDGAGSHRPDGRERQPGRARGRRHQRPRQLERDPRGARLDDRVQYVDLATGQAGGGGLHSTATTEIVNTTVHGNTASFRGGGLHFLASGSPALRSVTVSGNTSDNDANGDGHRRRRPDRRHGSDLGPQLRARRQHDNTPPHRIARRPAPAR